MGPLVVRFPSPPPQGQALPGSSNVITQRALGQHRGNPQFGQTRVFRPTAEGEHANILQVDAIPDAPSTVTIQLARLDDNSPSNAKPVARIQARCGGVMFDFKADWSYGQVITLCCDGVTVDAIGERINEQPYLFSTPGWKLAAAVGLRTIPGRVTYTELQKAIGPALATTQAIWRIPRFAIGVFFQVYGDFGGSTNSTGAWDDPALAFSTNSTQTVNARQLARSVPSFWPLAAGASIVVADSPVSNVSITPMFQLAL